MYVIIKQSILTKEVLTFLQKVTYNRQKNALMKTSVQSDPPQHYYPNTLIVVQLIIVEYGLQHLHYDKATQCLERDDAR